ncbi:MAG: hypothetical protein NBV68_02610 [Erythrobacter sp.]|uniref:hypothetical protein n=1 Tax=Erythrobacter sp. TaxID=1042 RepID=UPI0025DA6417|nr:hypothetical protein [Erythrobacter sp.]MCL9998249.1 hypothetical protein [Erythrobacter sp.]
MRGGRARVARLSGASLALIACALGVAAEAQTKPRLACYTAEFRMEPIQKPAEAVWIPEDSPIFETRLLPLGLYEVEQPVVLAGTTLLRPGDQLMAMRSKTTPVRCNYPQLKSADIAARERICVFDPDGDGSFDRVQVRSRGGDNWFAMAWEHPKEGVQTIAPVSMKPIAPTAFRGGPSITFYADHIPLRRKPRDGSPPYYEAFTRAKLYGADGLNWPMSLGSPAMGRGLLGGDVVLHHGLLIKVEEVAAEKTLISYKGNFDGHVVSLPFLNSYEHKCDTSVRMGI